MGSMWPGLGTRKRIRLKCGTKANTFAHYTIRFVRFGAVGRFIHCPRRRRRLLLTTFGQQKLTHKGESLHGLWRTFKPYLKYHYRDKWTGARWPPEMPRSSRFSARHAGWGMPPILPNPFIAPAMSDNDNLGCLTYHLCIQMKGKNRKKFVKLSNFKCSHIVSVASGTKSQLR